MPERMLRIKDVIDRTGLGRSTLYRMAANGEFPKARQLSVSVGGAVGWLESEIDEWLRTRPQVDMPRPEDDDA